MAPCYIIDEHTRIPELVLMSRVTARRMTVEDMDIIRKCARESTKCERQALEEKEKLRRMASLCMNSTAEAEWTWWTGSAWPDKIRE